MITQDKATAMLRGAIKSITIWVAALAEVLGEIAPNVPALCSDLGLDPTTTNHVLRVVAVVMLICRSITTKSLHDKGAIPASDVPSVPIQKGYIMIRMCFLLAAMALSVMTLSGCALIESPAAQPFDTVAIDVGVDAVVGINPITAAPRAAAIQKIAMEVLAADTGTLVTVDALLTVINGKVAALQLPPGDAEAAALFVAVVETAVNTYVAKLPTNATAANVQAAVGFVAKAVIAETTKLGGA